VVDVKDDGLEPESVQEMDERHRIGSARAGDADAIPVADAEPAQGRHESFFETHAVSLEGAPAAHPD
jgi:hypothetical protein